MYRADYHIHTHFSFDSEETLEAICERALALGLDEVGVSDHFSVNPADKSFGLYPYEQAYDEFLAAREISPVPLKFGLEIGEGQYRREVLADFLEAADYDYILGAVHNLGDITIRQFIRSHGIDAAYQAYFEELLKLARLGDCDILAHFDLIQRYAFDEQGIYRETGYGEIIDEILKTVADRGMAIEVNSSACLKNCRHFMPDAPILKRYRELGGEYVTFGSDAHQAGRIGESLDQAADMLKSLGFSYITTYEKRQPVQKSL
ncbi:MAG: histidinol-phosphatase HisJ family protein [Eubacterium sp.]|nr:histidinol-phosphatase HisJ family protein [Eubacterium sp.]